MQAARISQFDEGRRPEADLSLVLAGWKDRRELAICFDRRRVILGLNEAFAVKVGRPEESLVGASIVDLIHPDDREDWNAGTDRLMADQKPVAREHRWQAEAGWRWLSWEEAFVFDAEKRPVSVVAIARDVTHRRLSEAHFSKLGQAVEQSPVAILLTGMDGRVHYVNPAYTESSGYTLEELIEGDIRVLREGHPTAESYREFETTILAGRVWRGELGTRRKDGSILWERVQVSPVRGPTGEMTELLCLREDITVQKNLELQLQQAQKMESLGTLASGIAHDFNNILAIIRGFTELLSLRGNLDEPSTSKVRKILEATHRASDLIRRILTFSRQGDVSFRLFWLNAQIEEFVRLLRETFPRNIQINLDLEPGLPPIAADAAQIQQVIMNLCVNARDAMKNGGELRLKTFRVFGGSVAHLHLARELDYVCLEVSDTGVGMSQEVVARIFEPFYTTKEKSGGTGLGLSVVYGIINNHYGTIDLRSTVGEGTTFSIYLPINEGDEVAVDPDEPENFPGGAERIVIVDDEPGIRDLLMAAFQSHGYAVQSLTDGQQVRQALQNGGFDFDAVILDLDMPHVGGVQVLQDIRSTLPEIPVVVVTGHLEANARFILEEMDNVIYLIKPFHLNTIGTRMRRLLDTAGNESD